MNQSFFSWIKTHCRTEQKGVRYPFSSFCESILFTTRRERRQKNYEYVKLTDDLHDYIKWWKDIIKHAYI